MILKRPTSWTVIKISKDWRTVMSAMTVHSILIINHQGNTWKMIKHYWRSQEGSISKKLTHQSSHLQENWLRLDNRSLKLVVKKLNSFVQATGNLNLLKRMDHCHLLRATEQISRKSLNLMLLHILKSQNWLELKNYNMLHLRIL